jgi:hypothetical protein
MKNADNRFAHIALASDTSVYANFDLELGVLGTKTANVESSFAPAGDDWYRCTMTITSILGTTFIVTLTIVSFASRTQANATSKATFLYFPQMKLDEVPTSYIPTSGARVTRAADIVQNILSLSTFRLYGSRDFNGSRGEVEPPGSNVNVPPWVSFKQSSVGISEFGG